MQEKLLVCESLSVKDCFRKYFGVIGKCYGKWKAVYIERRMGDFFGRLWKPALVTSHCGLSLQIVSGDNFIIGDVKIARWNIHGRKLWKTKEF